jgi:hypothetical protein
MKHFVFLFFLLVIFQAASQECFFSEPVRIPLQLSGSFAELRSDHFHSGIDIRTQGKTGLPVYAAADGYISRVVVSPTGFGHALYIDHPNGTTTVYGHLESFREPLASWVKDLQYQKESFSLDVSPPPGKFPVTPNTMIARSGNSGSSGGPHLHFEIRDQKTQDPLNPLNFIHPVEDHKAPEILSLAIYPLDEHSHVFFTPRTNRYDVVFYDGKYHLKKNPVIPLHGKIGFGIESIDYLDANWSRCGINSLELTIDGESHVFLDLNRFAFAQTRYLNSLIDYAYFKSHRKRFYKTWKDSGNKLDIYTLRNHDGSLQFNDNQNHTVELQVKDSYGNTSVLEFTVKSVFQEINKPEGKGFQRFYHHQINTFEAEGVRLVCPENAFYTDFDFVYDIRYQNDHPDFFSDIHKIHRNTTPVHSSLQLFIKPKSLPSPLENKALIVIVDEKTGKAGSAGGSFASPYVIANIRAFGSYAVAVDTLPPSIKPLSIRGQNTLTESARIRFRIDDDLSGIKNYRGTIDNQWVLFEYDAKNNLIVYTFDSERLEFNKNHHLKLVVSDQKNNMAVYEAAFYK